MGKVKTIDRFDDPNFYGDDPHATFKRLRSESPVFWYEEGQFWVLTKYEDIKFVSSQPKQFSSQGIAILSDLINKKDGQAIDRSGARGVMFMDPPEHGPHRKAVGVRFTPKEVAGMDTHVRNVIAEILDELPDEGFDWMELVAERVPVDVFSVLMGLPREDWRLAMGDRACEACSRAGHGRRLVDHLRRDHPVPIGADDGTARTSDGRSPDAAHDRRHRRQAI